MSGTNELRHIGNAAFAVGEWDKAVVAYTKALELESRLEHQVALLSNRSATYLSMGEHELALDDARVCLQQAPASSKGYHRQGATLCALQCFDQAVATYQQGLQQCPPASHPALQEALDAAQQATQDQKQQSEQQQQQQQSEAVGPETPQTNDEPTTTPNNPHDNDDANHAARRVQRQGRAAWRASLHQHALADHASNLSSYCVTKRRELKLQIAALQAQLEFLELVSALPSNKEKLNLLFNVVDKDRDGLVNAKDLAYALLQGRQQFDKTTTDGDGNTLASSLQRAIQVVAIYDTDGDARLDRDEFEAYVRVFLTELDVSLDDFCEYMILQSLFGESDQNNKNGVAVAAVEEELVARPAQPQRRSQKKKKRRLKQQQQPIKPVMAATTAAPPDASFVLSSNDNSDPIDDDEPASSSSSSSSGYSSDDESSCDGSQKAADEEEQLRRLLHDDEAIDEQVKNRSKLLELLTNELVLELFSLLLDRSNNNHNNNTAANDMDDDDSPTQSRELDWKEVAIALFVWVKDDDDRQRAQRTVNCLLDMKDCQKSKHKKRKRRGKGQPQQQQTGNGALLQSTQSLPAPVAATTTTANSNISSSFAAAAATSFRSDGAAAMHHHRRTLDYEQFGQLLLDICAARQSSLEQVADELVLALTVSDEHMTIVLNGNDDDDDSEYDEVVVEEEEYSAAGGFDSNDFVWDNMVQRSFETASSDGEAQVIRLQRVYDLWQEHNGGVVPRRKLQDALMRFQQDDAEATASSGTMPEQPREGPTVNLDLEEFSRMVQEQARQQQAPSTTTALPDPVDDEDDDEDIDEANASYEQQLDDIIDFLTLLTAVSPDSESLASFRESRRSTRVIAQQQRQSQKRQPSLRPSSQVARAPSVASATPSLDDTPSPPASPPFLVKPTFSTLKRPPSLQNRALTTGSLLWVNTSNHHKGRRPSALTKRSATTGSVLGSTTSNSIPLVADLQQQNHQPPVNGRGAGLTTTTTRRRSSLHRRRRSSARMLSIFSSVGGSSVIHEHAPAPTSTRALEASRRRSRRRSSLNLLTLSRSSIHSGNRSVHSHKERHHHSRRVVLSDKHVTSDLEQLLAEVGSMSFSTQATSASRLYDPLMMGNSSTPSHVFILGNEESGALLGGEEESAEELEAPLERSHSVSPKRSKNVSIRTRDDAADSVVKQTRDPNNALADHESTRCKKGQGGDFAKDNQDSSQKHQNHHPVVTPNSSRRRIVLNYDDPTSDDDDDENDEDDKKGNNNSDANERISESEAASCTSYNTAAEDWTSSANQDGGDVDFLDDDVDLLTESMIVGHKDSFFIMAAGAATTNSNNFTNQRQTSMDSSSSSSSEEDEENE